MRFFEVSRGVENDYPDFIREMIHIHFGAEFVVGRFGDFRIHRC